jgi:hypothetical protein
MENLKQNIHAIAYFDEEEDGGEDEEEEGGEDELLVEDGEVYHTVDKEGGSLVEKLLTFF